MYRYQYTQIHILFFILLNICSISLCAASAAINQQLQREAKMISPALSKSLQEEYEKAQQEVEKTLKELQKAQREHDMPAIGKALQASQEAQLKLEKIRKELNAKK